MMKEKNMDNKPKVFLSYSSRDNEIVQKLARILKDKESVDVWLDRWELIPGQPWQNAIEVALETANTILLLIGPDGLGRWAAEEFRFLQARQSDGEQVRFIPVLLPDGDVSKIPPFLQKFNFIDLRNWDDEELYRLTTGIKGETPGRIKSSKPSPKVFLCHAKEDAERIEELYFLLQDEGLDPWFDKEKLFIGDKWEDEIIVAIENSDFFAVFLSDVSVNKTGFIQKEIRTAVNEYQRRPQGTAYLLPVRLEECQVPKMRLDYNTYLPDLQWIDVFNDDYDAIKKLATGIWRQWDKYSAL